MGDPLNDRVTEHVARLLPAPGKAQDPGANQVAKYLTQGRCCRNQRMDLAQHVGGENAPDRAGYLDGQLPVGREPVDAAHDQIAQCVGQPNRREIRNRQPAPAAIDGEDAAIAQRQHQLLGKERQSVGSSVDEFRQCRRNRVYPKPLADDFGDRFALQPR